MEIKKKGFTLIELLVVISIIALLLAIMMPALSIVKKKAKTVVCKSNLRQWGIVFGLYVQDNGGKYYKAWTSTARGHEWIGAARPYYQDPEICFCPEATKVSVEPIAYMNQVVEDRPWGRFPENDTRIGHAGMAGSYGANEWVGNTKDGVVFGDKSMYWTGPHVKGANNAPLFMDSVWPGGFPMDTDPAPRTETGDFVGPMMKRYCIDRHEGSVNSVFVDFSVRKVNLKELWKLKWHRSFDTSGFRGDWPDWMVGFKE